MGAERDHDITTDDKFGSLRLIDLPPVRTAILMVEPCGVVPARDAER